ncbi:MAG: tRNA (N6-threonylcarbamoyladenosine(37)-N6)-methyltransferase TrmO [Beijerinckiaceae bacterium]|nr:MAG: tRNA (N6-threonylcarbamoyladenosine(37)-N6)-methyltransferase TrmO [Beijerinckiaceae bacterium]
MATKDETIRPGETAIDLPDGFDAAVYFIGRIRTPWRERGECPRQGDRVAGPECRIEIDARWRAALSGIERSSELQILYWMNFARRDLVLQMPRGRAAALGTFALRSPARPNPIASSLVTLLRVEDATLIVRGLDCLDGTPLIDVKPSYNKTLSSPDEPAKQAKIRGPESQ